MKRTYKDGNEFFKDATKEAKNIPRILKHWNTLARQI